MDHNLVSARKYRPADFKSVVGQKALTATLKNAIATSRLAHSYLFCGSRGVGKTSCARIFAKTINCEHLTPEGEACNECESCRAFNNGISMNIIELDAASNNGVDDIRKLVEQVQNPPANGRYRVFIVDEVHMLSSAAFNAFLKTLEEPPSYVIFILATTEKNKILPTILSRCQIYDFNRITVDDIAEQLQYVAENEGYTAEKRALSVIARQADGALRDALSIFDQVAASSRGVITYESTIANLNMLDNDVYDRLLTTFLDGKPLDAWMVYKDIRDRGFDSHFFINGLAQYLRDIMAAHDASTRVLADVSDEDWNHLNDLSAKCTPAFLYNAILLCNDADLHYKDASNKQFLVEVLLAKLCQQPGPSPDNTGSGEGRLQPIATVETGASTTAGGTPPPAQTTVHATPKPPIRATPVKGATPVAQRPVTQRPATPPRISLDPAANKTDEKANHERSADKPKLDRKFNDAELQAVWQSYITANPTAHLLVNTMRVCRPVIIEDSRLLLIVESEPQAEQLKNAFHALLPYLRQRLSNDNITIEIELNQGTPSPRTWNEREVLADIAKRNPAVQQFIENYNATIS